MFGSRIRFGRTQALTRQAALLFLVSILPVLFGVGWLNYQFARNGLEDQTKLDTAARTTHIQQTLGNVLLRELERLLTAAKAPALATPGAARSAAERAAAEQAYVQASPSDPARQAYVDNAAGQVLKGFREEYPNRAVVLLADAAGGLRSTTTGAWPYWDLHTQPWWPDLTHPGANPFRIARPGDVPGLGTLLFLAVPLTAADGTPAGVMAVGLKFADLAGPVLGEDNMEATTTLLVAPDRSILYAVPPWRQPGLPASWSRLLANAGGGVIAEDAFLVGYAPIRVAEGYRLDDVRSIRTLNGLGWVILRVTPTAVAFAPLNPQLTSLATGTAATALGVVLMALVVVRGLVTRPLQRLETVIAEVRRYGLVPEVVARSGARLPRGGNEIGRLGRHFDEMLQELVTLTQEREQTYTQQQVVVTSLRIAAGRLSSAAAEQQAITTSTSAALTQVLGAFAALDLAAATIADYARQIAGQADALRHQHRAGEAAIATTQDALTDLQQTAHALEAGTHSLAADANAAGTLIEEANEVADTTHLLSLNAVIEAAGAGGYGLRFQVIAEEVRNLATAASAAAAGIEATLARMAAQTEATATETHQARQMIDSGAVQMRVLSGMMQTLLESADGLAANAERIRLRSEAQRGHSSEVQRSSNQLATAMHQLAAASHHVAAQAQELLQLANALGSGQPGKN